MPRFLSPGAESAYAEEAIKLSSPCPTTGLRRRLQLPFGALPALPVVSGAAEAAQDGQRSFRLTGQHPFLNPYRSGPAPFPEELASARELVTSGPKLARSGS